MAEKTVNYIYEEMKNNDYLNKNTLYLDTNITTEVINILARQLTKLGEQELAKDKSKRKPIKIIISCYGGELQPTFYFIDKMEYYINRGIEIHTYVTSYACSGGFKIAICGSKRFGYKHSMYLCHQWSRFRYGQETYQDTINQKEHDDLCYKMIIDIIEKKTKITKEMLDYYTERNRDMEFGSEKALELNVIDEIIE